MHSSEHHLISYDSLNIALQKANYIDESNLGGAMFWELSGDRRDEHGIVPSVARAFKGGLEIRENDLRYLGSSEYRI